MTLPPPQAPTTITIRELQPTDDPTPFRTLNEEWINRYFALEPKDREVLGDPHANILAKGGHIYLVDETHPGGHHETVGCVALIRMDEAGGDAVYELSKMAVSPTLRGRGIGRQLLLHVIEQARAFGARSLFLGSSTKLPNAVHLYASVGFQHVPQDRLPPMPYARADVFMSLPL
jgi:N-acetylglutamate synthase-like GNAT family acetyltransferase